MNFSFRKSQISCSNGIIYYNKNKVFDIRSAITNNSVKPKPFARNWDLNKIKNVYLPLDEITYLRLIPRGMSNLYCKVDNNSNYYCYSLFQLNKLPLPVEYYYDFLNSLEELKYYGLKKLIISRIIKDLSKQFDLVVTTNKDIENVSGHLHNIYNQSEVDEYVDNLNPPENSKIGVILDLSTTASYYIANRIKMKYPSCAVLPFTVFQVHEDHANFDQKRFESWVV